MPRSIFISYRRDDTEGEAGRLFDDLIRDFGEDSVFMDVAGIDPGIDFRKAIDENVSHCGVLLAMIGPHWTAATGAGGQRRIDDANDFVRLEIASALARNIAVIPVLVHDANMPRPDQLPDNLKDLAFRNSVEITHARWNSDVQLLTQALKSYVSVARASEENPVHATVPVQLPPPHGKQTYIAPKAAPSKIPLFAGIAVVVVIAIAAVAFYTYRGEKSRFKDFVPASTNAPVEAAVGDTSPVAEAPKPVPVKPRSSNSAFAGKWINPAASGRNTLARLEIAESSGVLTIGAWGTCRPVNCDWGEQTAAIDGQRATARWEFPASRDPDDKGRVANVAITAANGSLVVNIKNTYPARSPTSRTVIFVPSR